MYDHDDYDDYDCMDEVLYYTGYNERESIIKLKNVAMLELPFIKLENAIIEKMTYEHKGKGKNEYCLDKKIFISHSYKDVRYVKK